MEKNQFDWTNTTEKRRYLAEHFKDMFPESVQNFLVSGSRKKSITDGEETSLFLYLLANEPDTRHDAHWQLQTYLLLEIWKLLVEFKGYFIPPTEETTPRPERKRREPK